MGDGNKVPERWRSGVLGGRGAAAVAECCARAGQCAGMGSWRAEERGSRKEGGTPSLLRMLLSLGGGWSWGPGAATRNQQVND